MNQEAPIAPPPAALHITSSAIADGQCREHSTSSHRLCSPLVSRLTTSVKGDSQGDRSKSQNEPEHAQSAATLALVVDTCNLHRAAAERGARAAYRAILSHVTGGQPWIGIAVLSQPVDGRPIDGYEHFFQAIGFTTFVWTPVRANGQWKTDADALLLVQGTLLMVRPEVTDLVVLSGDSDCRPLLEAARLRGKRTTVARYYWRRAAVIEQLADSRVLLDERHLLRR